MPCNGCRCHIDKKGNSEVHNVTEISVHYINNEQNSMILDTGAPVSLTGKTWLNNYCENMKVQLEDLDSTSCFKHFKFGKKITTSKQLVKIPIRSKDLKGNEKLLTVDAYLLETNTPFLCGLQTLEEWKGIIDMSNKEGHLLETNIKGVKYAFELVKSEGGHDTINLIVDKDKQSVYLSESASLTKTLNESLEEMLKEADLDMVEDLRIFEDKTKMLNEDLNKSVDKNVFDDYEFCNEKIDWEPEVMGVHLIDEKGEKGKLIVSRQGIKNTHILNNHKRESQMKEIYKTADMYSKEVKEFIKDVILRCEICQKSDRAAIKPKTTLPKVQGVNEVITLDLKQFGDKYVLWMIDSFSKFMKGALMTNKKSETIISNLQSHWNYGEGFPTRGYWADNGGEFVNKEMEEFMAQLGRNIKFGPAWSPWSNGINERNHASADITIQKLLDEVPKKALTQEMVNRASWTHNTSINVLGFSPMLLKTGVAATIPGITMGDMSTEGIPRSDSVRQLMEDHFRVQAEYRKAEMRRKLAECQSAAVREYKKREPYQPGDKIYYMINDTKNWAKGEVAFHKHGTVHVYAMGQLIKVAENRVKPMYAELIIDEPQNKKATGDLIEFGSGAESSNSRENRRNKRQTVDDDKDDDNRRLTRSMTAADRAVAFKDLEKDTIAAHWVKVDKQECLDPFATYVVEVPRKEWHKPEIMMAQEKELENLILYDTFEEVVDTGQERIGSRWIITQKEKHDGQKQEIKARLVARGFQEEDKPQSDSPTVLKESMKLFWAIAANEGFKLQAIDIRAAFLQSENLDRQIFMKPPSGIKLEGKLWRLNKPLYGLDDASRKFWLKIKEIFFKLGMLTIEGDEAFYFRYENGALQGMIITHVDDFQIAGTEMFNKNVREEIERHLTISKISEGAYRFTGVDVKEVKDGIEISMDEYVTSIEPVTEIRKVNKQTELTGLEMKQLRKVTGKVSWAGSNTRPDVEYTALMMSKHNKRATIADLIDTNRVIKKLKERKSMIKYSKLGAREDLEIIGIGDASHRIDDKAVGGNLVLIVNSKKDRAAAIMWKSKQISRVVHSSKDAETLNLIKLVDDSLSAARQLENLMYGNIKGRINIRLYTDSEPTLESIASSRQVERKLMRPSVKELKERIRYKEIESYSWLSTKAMVADVLTKEMKMPESLEKILYENKYTEEKDKIDCIRNVNGEIRMFNIRNRIKGPSV